MVFQYGKPLLSSLVVAIVHSFNSTVVVVVRGFRYDCGDRVPVRGVAMEVQTPFRLYASFVRTLRRDATEVRRRVVPSRCGTPFRFVSRQRRCVVCRLSSVTIVPSLETIVSLFFATPRRCVVLRFVTQVRCVVVPFRRGAERRFVSCAVSFLRCSSCPW